MSQNQLIEFQKKQLEHLRQERAAAMEALDLAASLGSFSTSYSQQRDHLPILQEICARARTMIQFQTTAIYLMEESTYDFRQTLCDPPDQAGYIDAEITALIQDHSFAFVLQSNESHFFLAKDRQHHLLLHTIGTTEQPQGLFIGELQQNKNSILDTTRKLFTVVMLSAAHTLESHKSHKLFQENNARLETKVQKRTQDLVEANDKLKLILKSIQAGVILINANSRVIEDINPAALAILKADYDSLVGKTCYSNICFEPETNCPLAYALSEKVNVERLLTATDGTIIPILENVTALVLGGKKYFLKSFIDITEQKKLNQLKEDVERITRHDLKTPLNGIINLPDIIQDCGPLNDKQRAMLQHVKSAGYKMMKIVNMSLDLYKMEMGTYAYAPSIINVLPILQTALLDLDTLFHALEVSISISVDGIPVAEDTSVMLACEEMLMYSLLSNLITNAAEASPRKHHVSINILQFKQAISIEIHNFGVIPPEIRNSFFEKYITHGKKGGTGLGTYSAKLITNTMGATITIATSESTGTSVTITFPHCSTLAPYSA